MQLYGFFYMKKVISYLQLHSKQSLVFAIGWTLLIFYGCSRPGKDLPKVDLFDNFDKIVHFTFFFIFFLFWHYSSKSYKYKGLLILIISFLYGLGIEFYQKYCITGRGFDMWDVAADTLGAVVCYFIVLRLNNKIV